MSIDTECHACGAEYDTRRGNCPLCEAEREEERTRQSTPAHLADDSTLARIAELERECRKVYEDLGNQCLRNTQLIEENAELRRDAERYRWLRQYPVGIRPWDYYKLYTNELDAKIDAIASEKENKRE